MPIAAAIPSIIGAGGSLVSGILGSRAAKKAGQEQSTAGEAAAADLLRAGEGAATGVTGAGEGAAAGVEGAGAQGRDILLSALAGLDPYSDTGRQAMTTLAALFGEGGDLRKQFSYDPDTLDSDKGFQFRLKQGQQAIERSAAARGTLVSGGTLKGIADYSQDLASTEYGKAFDRARTTFQMNRDNTLGGLLSLTGIGERANAQRANLSQATADLGFRTASTAGGFRSDAATRAGAFRTGAATGAADYRTDAAASRAAGTVGSANAWQRTLGDLIKIGKAAPWQKLKRQPASGGAGADYGGVGYDD
jgi:hypothetical protein